MSPPTEERPEVRGQRTDVGPGAALHIYGKDRAGWARRAGGPGPLDVKAAHRYRPRRSFHLHALAGELMEPSAAHLQRRDHRRDLGYLAGQAGSS